MSAVNTFDSSLLEFRQQRQLAHELCRNFARSPSKANLKKIKQLFKHCGESVFVEPGFHCDYGDKISVGNNSYLNINCTLLDGGMIDIGDDCLIGPNVQILTVNHALDPELRRQKLTYPKDVIIENNVWIGAGAILLPGVHIHANSVVAAGSVVSKNVAASSLVAGNPARRLKSV